MKFKDNGIIVEDNEERLRTCWECNPAHEHLKKVNTLHLCFECGRYCIFDKFLCELENEEKTIEWLKSKGLRENQSTTGIDAGYRITEIKIERK